jgi:serine/threonine protein kinase
MPWQRLPPAAADWFCSAASPTPGPAYQVAPVEAATTVFGDNAAAVESSSPEVLLQLLQQGSPPIPQAPLLVPAATATPRDSSGREKLLTELEKVKYSSLQFVESLGSGEFGQVFRGFYQGQEVAIKQLYWDETGSAHLMRELAKEIESFRHLRHRRLVRFIGACLEMPHPCLVTEYMPGGSLHHLLHVRKRKLPTLHAMNMCMQVVDGVMYLHSQTPTVVHRDLKSLNVILDLGLNIKLCDFGLTEQMERTHITKRNNGGSPRYMAPELFDANTKITEKIDVWAMACVFVEIYGGPLPYENIGSLAELTREMLVHRRAPRIPDDVVPEDVRGLIDSCLDFDHQVRPSSGQVFEALKGVKRVMKALGRLD